MGAVGLRTSALTAAIAKEEWPLLRKRLTLYAFRRLRRGSRELAEEFAQEAIARAHDPHYAPWDPARHPDIFDYLGTIVNTLVFNHWQRTATRAGDVSLDEARRARDPAALDEGAARRDLAAAALTRLRERLADDRLALALFEARLEGDEKPAALAARLGVEVGAIYKAQRRLRAATDEIARALGERDAPDDEVAHGE